jgi:outer membrane protein assembly factor BamD (BamD/ComL family)
LKKFVCLFHILLLTLCLTACSGSTPSDAESTAATLLQTAQIEKDAGNFDKARELIAAAKAQYAAAGNTAGVKICNSRLEDLEIIQFTFPHTLTNSIMHSN